MERRSLVLVFAGALVCASCADGISGLGGGGGVGGGGGGGGPYSMPQCTPPESLSIAPSEESVEAGRAINLLLRAETGAWCVCVWSSSDSTVAVVSPWASSWPMFSLSPFAGPAAVVGLKPGAATITVSVAGKTATALIRVVAARTSFASVSTGESSCVVAAEGHVYCWGNINSAWVPTRMPGDPLVHTVSAGNYRACGITDAGAAYCWGAVWSGPAPLDTFGGYHAELRHPEPVLVGAGVRFMSVDLGGQDHACGVTVDSAAMCWGDNSSGQLGLGLPGVDRQPEPQPVAGELRFGSAVAGAYHSCALTGAGAAYCWGMGYFGQLGNGQSGSDALSVAAPVAVGGGLTFRQVSAGRWHTCGVTTAGAAYCWGLNDNGQLGSGDTVRESVPQRVAGSLSFTSVGAGYSHTCGLTTSGDVYCWGADHTCGVMTTGENHCWGADHFAAGSGLLLPTRVDAAVRFTSLSVGSNGACGLADDGRVYCWGYVMLGIGAYGGSLTPVRVSGQP